MLSNAEISELSRLKDKKARTEKRKFLIEGKRALLEAMDGDADISEIIVSLGVDSSKLADVYSAAEEKGINVEEVPVAKFSKLSSTETSQGIVAIAGIRNTTSDDLLSEIRSKHAAMLLMLDRISDPGNLGTILRSAAWFGVDGVVTAGGSVDAYNPKVVRSAMSAICQLNVLQDVVLTDEVKQLKKLGFTVVGSVQDASLSYTDFSYPRRVAVVLGAEATGISADLLKLCDSKVAIPRVGKMESLNVGVAASIILAEIARQKQQSKG